jgi:hypothetical protein
MIGGTGRAARTVRKSLRRAAHGGLSPPPQKKARPGGGGPIEPVAGWRAYGAEQPVLKAFRKQLKSSTLRTGGVVDRSQLA